MDLDICDSTMRIRGSASAQLVAECAQRRVLVGHRDIARDRSQIDLGKDLTRRRYVIRTPGLSSESRSTT